MKTLLIILFGFLPCLSCRPGSGNASPLFAPVQVSVESGKFPGNEVLKRSEVTVQDAGKAKGSGPVQNLLEPELLALLLLIMLLGMMYSNPSR